MQNKQTALECLGCHKPIPFGFVSCFHCGGLALYQSPQEPWGVLVGPVISSLHRKEAAKRLSGLLDDFDSQKAENTFANGKSWVVTNLSQEVAKALVVCLDPQKTLAQIISGKPPRKFSKLGTLTTLGGAAGISLVAQSLLVTVATLAASAAGTFLQSELSRRPLGKAPLLPETYQTLATLGRETSALLKTLEGNAKNELQHIALVVSEIFHQTQSGMLPSLSSGYSDGLLETSQELWQEALLLARQIAKTKESSVKEELSKLSKTLEHTKNQLAVFSRERGEKVTKKFLEEIETLQSTLDELKHL